MHDFLGQGSEDESKAPPEPPLAPEPESTLANGGTATFIWEGNLWYEVHIFNEKGTHSLSFPDGTSSINADYLIVAGGGAGGHRSAHDNCGGGAGGLLYRTGETLILESNSIAVTVGAGGVVETQGANGGYSAIGTIKVRGGGAGKNVSGNTVDSASHGLSGGSGAAWGAGIPGYANSGPDDGNDYTNALGQPGGRAFGSPVSTNEEYLNGGQLGGGGGGATERGGEPTDRHNIPTENKGGAGWKPADYNTAWIEQVTGTTEFSHGGRGGGSSAAITTNYGDGGTGAHWPTNHGASGGNGSDGIVVIRFPRVTVQ
jgi:hypothetical protein